LKRLNLDSVIKISVGISPKKDQSVGPFICLFKLPPH
jgi:hypothetical protein